MTFKTSGNRPVPLLKQGPKKSLPCLPRLAVAVLLLAAALIGVLA